MSWFAPILAFCISVALNRALLSDGLRHLALDQPNERSLHSKPIPRSGGIAIVLAMMAALWTNESAWPFWGLAAVLSFVSFADDRMSLSVGVRLLAHFAAAGAAVAVAMPHAAPAAMVVAVISIVWMTNLYNFMDGSDALAGAMAATGFGAYAAAAAMVGETQWALAFLCVVMAALGFLIFNRPPARIFMGDVGSVPLGFLSACAGLWGWANQWWPAWFPLMAFAPFIVDASVTLLRRGLRGEKVWRAHREHCYQRFVLSGWPKEKLARWATGLMLLCALWALVSLRLAAPARDISLTVFLVALCVLWGGMEVRHRRVEGRRKERA